MRKMLVIALLLVFTEVSFAQDNDLSGVIRGPDHAPLSEATVYVYSGRVREGTNLFCATCYPDCGKRAETGADGQFRIVSLNPALRFELLVVAKGYLPKFIKKVIPGDDEIAATLAKIPETRMAPEHRIRGRVINPNGDPVIGATIEVTRLTVPELVEARRAEYTKLYDGKTQDEILELTRTIDWSFLSKYEAKRDLTDQLAVTDEEGVFRLTSEYSDAIYDLLIRAEGLAPKKFWRLSSGPEIVACTLGVGITLSGKVAASGATLDNVVMGVIQRFQSSGDQYGEFTVGADANGYFEIPNLPPNRAYYIYGKMESLQGNGVLERRYIGTHGEGERVDTGVFELTPGHHIQGRVIFSDGKPIPPKTQLSFSPSRLWDTLYIDVEEDGTFDAPNVNPGPCRIWLHVPGYYMSRKNISFEICSLDSLRGTISGDYQNLVILMEEGEPARGSSDPKPVARPVSEPLRGYEGQ